MIVDWLTKALHFLTLRPGLGLEKLAELYLGEIIRLQDIPVLITSDRASRFISRFWSGLQSALDTKLTFCTAFHPQTDGQFERIIKTMEDMLQACALDFSDSWNQYLPLPKFVYNNNFQANIQMALYEAFYGWKCRSLVCWDDVGERKLSGPEILQIVAKKVKLIRGWLKAA